MASNRSQDEIDLTKARDFKTVFQRELKYILARRESFKNREIVFTDSADGSGGLSDSITPEALDDDSISVEELQERAIKEDFCGLAISGGGIRSATFGLGVLQGLAKASLLPRIDFLSTVSGGGYVGSFLSKWIYEDGFESAESGLIGMPHGHPVPNEKRLRIHSRANENSRINHLREYSNYLAPVPGLFSLDGWLLIAIYIRNLFLNQLVLFLGAFSFVLAARFLIEIYCETGRGVDHNYFSGPTGYMAFVIVLACFAAAEIWLMRLFYHSCARKRLNPTLQDPENWWLRSRIASILIALWVSCLVDFTDGWNGVLGIQTGATLAWWTVIMAQVIGFSLLAVVCHNDEGSNVKKIVIGAIAGFVGGLVSAIGLSWSTTTVQTNATFSPPIIILSFVLSEMFYVGIVGRSLPELDREWWSSINSRLLRFAFIWAGVMACVVYGPWAIGSAICGLWEGNYLPGASVLTGSISTLAGLWAARSGNTGDKKNRVREMLAALAPFAFLVLMLMVTATIAVYIAYDVFAYLQGQDILEGFVQIINDGNYFNYLNTRTPSLESADPDRPIPAAILLIVGSVVMALLAYVLGWRIGVNTFSLHNMYANRLTRCYLGASTGDRDPNVLTDFDIQDDVELSRLRNCKGARERQSCQAGCYLDTANGLRDPNGTNPSNSNGSELAEAEQNAPNPRNCEFGPFHIINGALNLTDRVSSLKAKQDELRTALRIRDRKCESFVFTPLFCGSESTGYHNTDGFANDIKLGQALAVSGAAVSPNMGYHSSPAITALLTVFNLRLGAWFGNPATPETRMNDNPTVGWELLMNELIGKTNATDEYVYVSDGGHFENMGIYELIRRRCRFIFAVDADSAPNFHENIGRLVRMARMDFGVRIDIDSTHITPDESGNCIAHVVVGRVHYCDVHTPESEQPANDPSFNYDNNQGIIVWVALAMTGDEPADVQNYRAMNPEFPYRSTGDQFFDENQFESYRELGEHSIETILRHCTLPTSSKMDDLQGAATSQRQQITYAYALENTKDKNEYQGAKTAAIDLINNVPTRRLFESIYDQWLESPRSDSSHVSQNEEYVRILQQLRQDPELVRLADCICGNSTTNTTRSKAKLRSERLMIGEMMTLLESVYISLNLKNTFQHPVHEGWLNVFKRWTGNRIFMMHWFDKRMNDGTGICHDFSPEFQRFIKSIC